ncbi:hypothetical protein DEU56DRAFT_755032 [Suillus clintonianus]|uniref:uncharacterized protein n=1 Tax=Suillus clintonianus TaxID=1904413 RepID=UPI001B870C8D|nr:uncharacterized protein DEU56DRAFT_755032 [Suillus clintonianus]KAG2141334.1 hypothetical protein DEU56DRAFT_755032 [Suillus clintonianus]
MSFNDFGGATAWGEPEQQPGDIVKDAIRKEKILKEISAAQGDLQGTSSWISLVHAVTNLASSALVARVHSVQSDVDKLTSENSTLQMYIDNLTMQMAKRK